MKIRPIKTEEDYRAALAEIDRLFDAAPDTPQGDRLEVLATLVEAYEDKHYSIPAPDPVEALLYTMESRGLTRKDLEPYIGGRARVSEILNRKRRLTLRMIQRLHGELSLPAEALLRPYALRKERNRKQKQIPSHRTAPKGSVF
jgi:HTH-type transcriptional regulator/antitoxin HigA